MSESIFADCVRDVGSSYEYVCAPSYSDVILRGTTWTVLADANIGDYQGDELYLIADGERRGFLSFGYGSCSGCDALQACNTVKDLEEERERLHGSIEWRDSAADLATWLRERDHDGQWYGYYADEWKAFVEKAIALLEDK